MKKKNLKRIQKKKSLFVVVVMVVMLSVTV